MKTQRNAESPDSATSGQPQGWDPYQVWLTRVKQPRENEARRAARVVSVEPAKAADLSETARLRALSAALPR